MKRLSGVGGRLSRDQARSKWRAHRKENIPVRGEFLLKGNKLS